MCMAFNYDEIEKALADMQPRQRLYELVKTEMVKRGRWKYEVRGWHIKGVIGCSIPGCERNAANGFFCDLHNINPDEYGAKKKTDIPYYTTWRNMLARCYNDKIPIYHRYGGRGIAVCDEWRDSFRAFNEYMGALPIPSEKYSIDRIDNNGNYEPGNVRWASYKTQRANQERSKK